MFFAVKLSQSSWTGTAVPHMGGGTKHAVERTFDGVEDEGLTYYRSDSNRRYVWLQIDLGQVVTVRIISLSTL